MGPEMVISECFRDRKCYFNDLREGVGGGGGVAETTKRHAYVTCQLNYVIFLKNRTSGLVDI